MAQKKINGYLIFMNQCLGKGSYGSVLLCWCRSTWESRTARSGSARWRSSRKSWVLRLRLSLAGRIPQIRPLLINSDPAAAQVRKHRQGLWCHGEHQQLLHHSGALRLRSLEVSQSQEHPYLTAGSHFSDSNLQWIHCLGQGRDCSQVHLI